MSVASELIVTEIGVGTAAILGGIGYVIRQARRNGEQARDAVQRFERFIVETRKDTRDHTTRLGKVERTVSTDHDDLTRVASLLEDHLRWHERHPGTLRPRP